MRTALILLLVQKQLARTGGGEGERGGRGGRGKAKAKAEEKSLFALVNMHKASVRLYVIVLYVDLVQT